MTFTKQFALFTFKYKRHIFVFNAFFWPLLAGIVSYQVLVPQFPQERYDGTEAKRIRGMLEDVKNKSREEKLDDAFHAMKYFMLPNQQHNNNMTLSKAQDKTQSKAEEK